MNINQLYQWMAVMNQSSVYGNYADLYGKESTAGQSFPDVLAAKAGRSGSYQGGIATPMDDIFEEAARTYGVDVNLLKAIGKAESGFDASATSHAGAMGVMQLMPGTASSLGVTDAYDARQNIMGGAKYISKLLNNYGGNVELALAAYNAGSGNVAKYNGVPPFTETRNYIKRVLGYAGEQLSTGRTVQTGTGGEAGYQPYTDETGELSSLFGTLDNSDAQKLVQMMRYQMELKLSSILSFDDSEGLL